MSAALLGHGEQMRPGSGEVDEGAGGLEPVQVFGQTAEADLEEAELELHPGEDMFDPRPAFAPYAVLFADVFADTQLALQLPVGAVDGVRCVVAESCGLALAGLVAHTSVSSL